MDIDGGMTAEDSKQMLTDAEMTLNPDVARLMDDRRSTLFTRNLIDVWKHDQSAWGSERGRPAAELRSLIMKKIFLNQESPMEYKPPTPPHKKRVRIKTGHVILNKRSNTRPEREIHSAPVTARNIETPLPRITTPQQSSPPYKPNVHNGYTQAPGKSVQVHISTPYSQRRPYSSDSQFSALMRSNSPKPRPHFHEGYASYLNGKQLKSSANLKSWKKQVTKHVEIKRKQYSIPVERKLPSENPEYLEEDIYSESQSSLSNRTREYNPGGKYDRLHSGSIRQAPTNRIERHGSAGSNYIVPENFDHGGIRSSISSRSGGLSRQSIYSQGSGNRYRSHLHSWNV